MALWAFKSYGSFVEFGLITSEEVAELMLWFSTPVFHFNLKSSLWVLLFLHISQLGIIRMSWHHSNCLVTPCLWHGGRYKPERKLVLFGSIIFDEAAEVMLWFSACVFCFNLSEPQNNPIYTVLLSLSTAFICFLLRFSYCCAIIQAPLWPLSTAWWMFKSERKLVGLAQLNLSKQQNCGFNFPLNPKVSLISPMVLSFTVSFTSQSQGPLEFHGPHSSCSATPSLMAWLVRKLVLFGLIILEESAAAADPVILLFWPKNDLENPVILSFCTPWRIVKMFCRHLSSSAPLSQWFCSLRRLAELFWCFNVSLLYSLTIWPLSDPRSLMFLSYC